VLALAVAVALRGRGLRHLADAVRDVVHHVEARDALLVQEVNGVRILLAEDCHQHVGARHFLLAGRLHVQDRALDHPLKAQCGLRVDLFASEDRRMFGDELGQQLPQVVDIRRAGAQHFGRRGIVEQRQQQVLHGDELMAFLARFHERHVQTDFQFLSDHLGSTSFGSTALIFFHHAL
jgi:hypothetical protein